VQLTKGKSRARKVNIYLMNIRNTEAGNRQIRGHVLYHPCQKEARK